MLSSKMDVIIKILYFITFNNSIAVVGALTPIALLHSVCDLKTARKNVQRKVMLYEFELGHNAAERTKNIYWA